jgi:Trk-type K+ transport system membrane component
VALLWPVIFEDVVRVQGNVAVLYKVKPRIWAACKGLLIGLVLIVIGAAMLHYLDGSDWLDCFYWALTTLSTVGK